MRLKVRKMDLQIAATALHHGAIVVTAKPTYKFHPSPRLLSPEERHRLTQP